MEELVERIARGNVTEVKVLLTSVAAALAVYQLVLIAVGYGKLRPRFLGAGPAAKGASRLGGHDRRAPARRGHVRELLRDRGRRGVPRRHRRRADRRVVTAKFGSTSAAELDARQERLEQLEELREERQERREEQQEAP